MKTIKQEGEEMNVEDAKTRVLMASIEDAYDYRSYHGGWIVKREDGSIYHYSYNYCRSEIMADLPDNLEILQ